MAFYALDFRTSGPSWTNPVTYGSGNYSEFGRNAFGTYVGPLSLNKLGSPKYMISVSSKYIVQNKQCIKYIVQNKQCIIHGPVEKHVL